MWEFDQIGAEGFDGPVALDSSTSGANAIFTPRTHV
jgi:hypothetical protein